MRSAVGHAIQLAFFVTESKGAVEVRSTGNELDDFFEQGIDGLVGL